MHPPPRRSPRPRHLRALPRTRTSTSALEASIASAARARQFAWAGNRPDEVLALADRLDDLYAQLRAARAAVSDPAPYRGGVSRATALWVSQPAGELERAA